MSSTTDDQPSIQPGGNHYEKVLGKIKDSDDTHELAEDKDEYNLSIGSFSEEELKYAKKVAEAEYINENGTEEDLTDTFFSRAGTEGFDQILQGAKHEMSEEQYKAGKLYLLVQGSEAISDSSEEFLRNQEEMPLTSDQLDEIFRSEFDNSYDPEDHGVNPHHINPTK